MTTRTDQETNEAASDDKSEGGGLRNQLEKSLARTKELEAEARTRAFQDAGLNTETGLGKAINQIYTGDNTKEAILAYASTEYGHVPQDPAAPAPHPQAAQIALGQHQLDQVGNVAGSVQQTTRGERLSAAEASGDFETQAAIKSAQMQEMVDRQNRPQ